jgi:hypothetical protein
MRHTRLPGLLPGIGTFLITLAPALFGQDQVSTLELIHEASFPEPFTSITGLRELSDGRLLIADRTERHVSLLDFGTGTIIRLGRQGGGPGEYEIPARLLPLPGDSSLLVDFGNLRLTRITPDGRFEQSISTLHESGAMILPVGADAFGRVYFTGQGSVRTTPGRRGAGADSTPIIRWELDTDRFDTVAMQARTPRHSGAVRLGDGRFHAAALHSQPFTPVDAWAVAWDGRVAVARATTYRVDWTHPNGWQTQGPDVPYRPVRITDAEKEAWAERLSGSAVQMLSTGGAGRSRSFQLPKPDITDVDFPDVMPPFPRDAAHVTPEGELWVKRSQAIGEKQHLFDVFNSDGERIVQVWLPEGRRLVGFGRGTLYAVAVDEDDLQWLERYKR